MGVQIESYHASEIDPDSMLVTRFNHGDAVKQLGDVRYINEAKIKELVPIDLLIGGSPCNELSIANPKRRGLDGKIEIHSYNFFKRSSISVLKNCIFFRSRRDRRTFL